MTGKITGSGENQSPLEHTKRIEIEPNLNECDIKIEPVEDFDALLSGKFDVLHTNGDDQVAESASCSKSVFTYEEQLRSQLDGNNREMKKEEGPSIMTGNRNSSGEIESKWRHTKRIKIETNSDECDIKIEPVEDYDPLFSERFDVLQANGDDHIAESDNHLTSFISGSKLSNWNCASIAIAHQKSDKQLTSENLSETRSVQIDNSLDSAQRDMEMKATRESKDLFACNLCSYRGADNISEMKKHSLSHSEMKRRVSPHFDVALSFKSDDTPVSEPSTIYGTVMEFFCTFCSYRTSGSGDLREHILTHTGEKPFSCEFCSFKTGLKGNLNKHILTHTREKPFSCELCSFKAIHKSNLNQHISTHTGERPFSCELCSFKATLRGNLNQHILTHTGEKPFSCEHCSFKTNKRSSLNSHILTHTGEKPFSCELCSFKTSQRGSLNSHIFTHTGEKPFSCELCSYKTTSRGSLNRHILTHTGEKPFSCELCSFKTSQNKSLKRHILTHRGKKSF